MDNDTMVLLARFTIQARKLVGAIDSNLLANDDAYRNSIFQRIDAEADETLLLLSLTLRSKLGTLINPTAEQEATLVTSNVTDKYKFGARG